MRLSPLLLVVLLSACAGQAVRPSATPESEVRASHDLADIAPALAESTKRTLLVLDIEDAHVATYAIRKLEEAGLVATSRAGKEKLVAATAAAMRARVREIDVGFIGGFLFACGGAPHSFDVHMLVVWSYENRTEVLGMCELFGLSTISRSVAIKRPKTNRSS